MSELPAKKSASSAASRRNQQQQLLQPPFPLYKNPSKPSFQEGWSSIINLLRKKKRIVVLTGAGISVSCGIPDFRSRGTGLYSTLDAEELGLSCPEELFDFEVFQENPQPFFNFAKNLYFPLGNNERVRPSDSHKLLALLEERKMLHRVYSQNIDGLEQEAGVSMKKVVYAHGSLQWATCCKCKRKVSAKEIERDILSGTVARCHAPIQQTKLSPLMQASRQPSARSRKRPRVDECQEIESKIKTTTRSHTAANIAAEKMTHVCNGIMKPGVTFFGEALNNNVRRCLEADRNKVDALIVIGTSLSVAPISKVVDYLPPSIPRILINRTIAHPAHQSEDEIDEEHDKDFRSDYVFDAYLLGFCDDITRNLAKHLFAEGPGSTAEHIETEGKLLACVKSDDEHFRRDEWKCTTVPSERIFLFPGAQAPSFDDDRSELTYREVAHCDGCSERIDGIIRKCVACFDYDLCHKCYPILSKSHYDGKHQFSEEAASLDPHKLDRISE